MLNLSHNKTIWLSTTIMFHNCGEKESIIKHTDYDIIIFNNDPNHNDSLLS